MLEHRDFASLGHVQSGWLTARHHFSFGTYHDPRRMGWGKIRVWNDDEILSGHGFAPHPHRDMEIITFVRQGAITHEDSMGNSGRTQAGDVQVMSAGYGIRHSEYNLEDQDTRLFQIWVEPRATGGQPNWAAKSFPKGARAGRLEILASGYDDEIIQGALEIRADARLYGATLDAGGSISYTLPPAMHAYLVLSSGVIAVGDIQLAAGDGLTMADIEQAEITAIADSEIVIVETLAD